MQFHRDPAADVNLVTACGHDGIKVGETLLTTSCVVSAESIIQNWPVTSVDDLKPASIAPLLEQRPELILLGAGRRLRFPAVGIGRSIMAQSVGFEVMDTAAACRTYNVLVSEGRHVLAALIIESA
ncbi:MAG: Mth938-like domain-containing protein [Gammaproteobacteria bacterium]|nr:Mth938-like domain-containing protein [Gammaproteobacteria bacterium]NND58648.1 Xcc1710-like domain-containing protein [Gammaproteobacteria bacterium]